MDYRNLPKPFFVLAPMDDVTDTVFRQLIGEWAAPDLYFTEFVNVDGLQSPGRPKLLKKLQFTELDQPLIAQIWGKTPDNYYKTARQLADGSFAREMGLKNGTNFAGVDINIGCPDKTVVKNGTCVALMNDRPLAEQIIQATKEGLDGKLPFSIKTRTGFNEPDPSWIEFLLKQGLDMLTVHGRTRKEMSKVPAHWDQIGEARELRDQIAPDTLIVGNGDVESRQQGLELAMEHRLDGIMVGRGVFHDPFIFAEQSAWLDYTPQQRIGLYKRHVELFVKTWQHNERPIVTLNRFCKIYINHFDGAKELREHLMQAKTAQELIKILEAAS